MREGGSFATEHQAAKRFGGGEEGRGDSLTTLARIAALPHPNYLAIDTQQQAHRILGLETRE